MATLYYMTIKQTSRWAFRASWNAMQTYSILPIIAIPPMYSLLSTYIFVSIIYFYYLRSSRIVKATDKPTGINSSATRRVIKLTHNNLSQQSCFNWKTNLWLPACSKLCEKTIIRSKLKHTAERLRCFISAYIIVTTQCI